MEIGGEKQRSQVTAISKRTFVTAEKFVGWQNRLC